MIDVKDVNGITFVEYKGDIPSQSDFDQAVKKYSSLQSEFANRMMRNEMNIQSITDDETAESAQATIEKQRSLISKLALEKHELEQKLKAVSPEFNGKSQRVAKDSGGYA
jgi:uncharacterized FlaG/YvyC family protein